MKIGSFSAASNVTGVLTATNDVSILMHRANGFAFYDYASAAPYIEVSISIIFSLTHLFIHAIPHTALLFSIFLFTFSFPLLQLFLIRYA